MVLFRARARQPKESATREGQRARRVPSPHVHPATAQPRPHLKARGLAYHTEPRAGGGFLRVRHEDDRKRALKPSGGAKRTHGRGRGLGASLPLRRGLCIVAPPDHVPHTHGRGRLVIGAAEASPPFGGSGSSSCSATKLGASLPPPLLTAHRSVPPSKPSAPHTQRPLHRANVEGGAEGFPRHPIPDPATSLPLSIPCPLPWPWPPRLGLVEATRTPTPMSRQSWQPPRQPPTSRRMALVEVRPISSCYRLCHRLQMSLM